MDGGTAQGDSMSAESWVEQGKTLAKDTSTNSWALARWLVEGEDAGYLTGDKPAKRYAAAAQITGMSVGSLRVYAHTARHSVLTQVNGGGISFAHAKAVASQPPEVQRELLAKVTAESWTVAQLNKAMPKPERTPKPKTDKVTLELPEGVLGNMTTLAKTRHLDVSEVIAQACAEYVKANAQELSAASEVAVSNMVDVGVRMGDKQRERVAPLVAALPTERIYAKNYTQLLRARVTRLVLLCRPSTFSALVDKYNEVYGTGRFPYLAVRRDLSTMLEKYGLVHDRVTVVNKAGVCGSKPGTPVPDSWTPEQEDMALDNLHADCVRNESTKPAPDLERLIAMLIGWGVVEKPTEREVHDHRRQRQAMALAGLPMCIESELVH